MIIKFSDKLFKEIRDLNFEVVVQVDLLVLFWLFNKKSIFVKIPVPQLLFAVWLQVLRQKATAMKQDYTEVTTMVSMLSGAWKQHVLSSMLNDIICHQLKWQWKPIYC